MHEQWILSGPSQLEPGDEASAGIAFNQLIILHSSTYRGYHDKSQNGGGPNEEPSAENTGEDIDVHVQGVRDDYDDSHHDTRDVDSCRYVFSVVQALDFDPPYGESENQGDDLEQHLVAVEDAQSD